MHVQLATIYNTAGSAMDGDNYLADAMRAAAC
jgi:hypothetical protein